MGEVTVGPSVTQFTLKPAQGVNVRKILGLKDNLQMALSATNMHIEAPIPGKPFVGIEIPNEKKTLLGLRSILELKEFQEGPSLYLAIGKDIIGRPIMSDLGKMPHLLVAGATGTGKSITLHNLILSLLYKNSPHDLKLIILDPKRVEFTAYNALPHLYTPIIKDPKTAIKSLNWAAQEMDRRYDVLGEYGVPNINEYNKKIFFPALEKAKKRNNDGDTVSGLPPKMPFIVIVFDEYNDFMLTYPKEITPVITSLTQKARAAGIHLILATQRPDVKVITGTIKANIPSRIALKTTSQIDSRTILDQAGAEDLLGNGDMLYMNGSSITRVQAPFVSSEEIKSVIINIKQRYDDFVPDFINIDKIKISSSSSAGYREMNDDNNSRNPKEEPTDDEDYMSARDYVISTGKASTSSLQTAFRWGYNKSARIINDLESYGIIGPATSGRHREVLFGKNNESDVERLEREIKELEENKDA
jgi:S-DNA-T family DNA segregation ATPase FtsK/SpoIIIE